MAVDDGDDGPRVVPLKDAKRARDAAKATNGAAPHAKELDESEFRALGYDHGEFFFLSRRSGQIIALTSRALATEGALLELAPLDYWEFAFPRKGGFAKSEATNLLIQTCYQRGVFDVARIRGRGCWFDEGRAVLHLGHQLRVDGASLEVAAFPSSFIYEEAASLGITPGAALSGAEARRFLDLVELLRWERPWMATILAGWCVVAPICGALAWRPHIWLVAPKGSGKSWIQDNIVKSALAGIALCVQSRTTEAGLRQALRADARPVVFDEIDASGPRDRDRIQAIIEFARASSTEGGAPIAKGGMDGAGQTYVTRSAMCFASINTSLTESADQSRCTVLHLQGGETHDPHLKLALADHFEHLKAATTRLLTHDFSTRLLARSLALLPTIRANADTFARAAAEVMPSRRNGDQLGALLAGAATLHHSRLVTLDEARATVAGLGWVNEVAMADTSRPDHELILSHLSQQLFTVRPTSGPAADRTIGELIAVAGRAAEDGTVSSTLADETLRRAGIRVDRTPDTRIVWFANSHQILARLLSQTKFATNWQIPLLGADGAEKSTNSIRFGPGSKAKAVGIPLKYFISTVDTSD